MFDNVLTGGDSIWVDAASSEISCLRHRELVVGFPGNGNTVRADFS